MKQNMRELSKGKVVYLPPERCQTNVWIEETPHGLKLYKNKGDERHFMVLPWSKVIQVSME